MANFNVSFIYQLKNRFTATANKIGRAVEQNEKKLRRLQKVIDKNTKSMSGFQKALRRTGGRLAALGTVIAGGLGVKALVDFGAAMSRVEAVSGATSDQIAKMRLVAKDLGATTIFSASQAASGMEFLARAGFKTKDIIAAMPSVLDLAASSNIDLGVAADITSNILTGFGIKASETNKVADLMATIAANANTNIQQLGDAMKMVGPIASGMGQSIEVTAAAMGALSDAGLQGTMAGTGLRKVFSVLASPTKKISSGLKSLGVDLKKINPETNDLVVVMKELSKANLTAGQALQIFGERGGPAFQVLSKNIPKIEQLKKKLEGSAGAAKRMADIMANNLMGSSKQALSAIEGLIITLGDLGLSQVLRNVAGAITFVARGLNAFIEKFPRLTKFVATFVSLLITFKLATLAWAAATKLAVAAQLALNLAMKANVIGLIVIGIAAAVAGFIAFKDSIVGALDWVLELFGLEMPEWMKSLFGVEEKELFSDAKMTVPTRKEFEAMQLEVGSQSGGGLAAQEIKSRATIDGNINVNAAPGVVSSMDFKTKGMVGNLGFNMGAAL